ncbi:MAG: acetaldehyde dehydrogenase (acetylating) [Bacteroidota bacterium]
MTTREKAAIDRDLLSIQEARELVLRAAEAQEILATFDQGKVDRIVAAMAKAGEDSALRLAKMAVDETNIGVIEDKVLKNRFATANLHAYVKNLRTAGIIAEDRQRRTVEIAAPVGVIMGIVPTTNPTSTVLFKSIISIKARNAVIFSPHPRAVGCSYEAARIMEEAAVAAGAPRGAIGCLSICTREATDALMHHPKVALILATGGAAMVKAAYSAGKPAFGVGPGNVPAFIERTADVPRAVKKILASKTFDNGTICASEQAIVTEEIIADRVLQELQHQGGFLVRDVDLPALERTVIGRDGGVNPLVVGQSPKKIAEMAGIKIPDHTRVLLARLSGVGRDFPLSAEKLCPVLAFYVEKDWQGACERCYELLRFGGIGHTLVIHSHNGRVIMEFAMKKPVFRILVNTPSSQGAIGLTTGLPPSLTLGCGTWGGNSTSDNVGPLHLINRKRLAYDLDETREDGQDVGAGDFRFTREEVTEAVEAFLRSG